MPAIIPPGEVAEAGKILLGHFLDVLNGANMPNCDCDELIRAELLKSMESMERQRVVSGMPDRVPKSVTYDYEFYENTFYNDPSWCLVTDKPLLPFSVGDYVDNEISEHLWIQKSKDEVLQVAGVRHIISDVRSDRTHHRLAVCLKRVPKPNIF